MDRRTNMTYKLLHNQDAKHKIVEREMEDIDILRMARNYGLKTSDVADAISWIEAHTGFYKFEPIT